LGHLKEGVAAAVRDPNDNGERLARQGVGRRHLVLQDGQVHVEILGVVENMSHFSCPHCEGRIDVFGHGEGRRMAQLFGVPFLGEIEIDPQIRIGGDSGKPVASMGEDAPGGKSIFAVTRNVMQRVDSVNANATSPVVQIL